MSNGARHGLGVVIGLVLTPLIFGGLLLGTERISVQLRLATRLDSGPAEPRAWVGALVLAAVAVLVAVAAGSRLSPLASLVPGAILTGYGLLWFVAPRWTIEHIDQLPAEYDLANFTVGPLGIPVLIGVILLAASVIPSRWRATRPLGHRATAPFGGPGGPPPYPPGQQFMPGAPPPRYGQHGEPGQPGQYGQPGPYGQYGQGPGDASPPPDVPAPLDAPAPGRPPGRPSGGPPSPSSPPPGPPGTPGAPRPHREEAGEWTRMYGGDQDGRDT